MKKESKKWLTLAVACLAFGTPPLAFAAPAAEDVTAEKETLAAQDAQEAGENLGETVVTAERRGIIKNPYTTGGDVHVITRKDIEKRNYSTIADAIKGVPGVRVSTPGYRGGEYGYTYNTEFTINGENGIVVLVDGARVDNDASAFAGTKQRVNLSTLPGIDDVEQIEVMKGSGAAIYGADAAGGVISITTRRGTREPRTTLHVGTGSWGRHRYGISHTGSGDDGTLRYALSLTREQSGDTKYKDYYMNDTKTYANTRYREDNASFNITKDFDPTHSLSVNYYHSYEKSHYPITAPDYRYMDAFYSGTMAPVDPLTHRYTSAFGSRVPGYRNAFLYDAWLGSYGETTTNNVSAKYVFGRTDENAESYVRVFRNHTRYNMKDYSSIYSVPYIYLDEFLPTARATGNFHSDIEDAAGISLQLARRVGKHSLTGGVDYRKSEYEGWDRRAHYSSSRNLLNFYLQDKVQVSRKFALTPGLIYARYSSGQYNDTHFEGAKRLSFSLYGSYDFDEATNAYFSASQIFRPVTGLDRSREFAGDRLEDEKGWSYTAGLSRTFSPRDSAEINVGFTDMSNAIGRYSVWTGGAWARRSVNAERTKRSMNLAYTHRFDKAWLFGASYSWVHENFSTKNVRRDVDGTNPDDMVNAYRPRNIYRLHLSRDKDGLFTELAYTIYSGNDTRYFTRSHFGVLYLNVNYKFAENWQVYLNVYNLLNTAYETQAMKTYGLGAFPEPGRSFMLGVKYTF